MDLASVALFLVVVWSILGIQSIKNKLDRHSVFFAALFLLQALLFKGSVNRADSTHLRMTLWPALLAVEFDLISLSTIKTQKQTHLLKKILKAEEWNLSSLTRSRKIATKSILIVVLVLTVFRSAAYAVFAKNFHFFDQVNNPLPNMYYIDKSFREAVNIYAQKKPGCVLNWANVGAVSLFANTPACADVLYPVYIVASAEDAYLSNLDKNPPSEIIYSTAEHSYAIDGRSMSQRLPKIASWIRKKYTQDTVVGNWILLKRHDD